MDGKIFFIKTFIMKLQIMSLVAAAALAVSSCGTTRTSTSSNAAYDLPASVRADFSAQYPTATNVTWSAFDPATAPIDWELNSWTMMDANDYVVKFDLGADTYYAWYDSDGEWIGSAYSVVDHARLPASVHATLNSQFPGYNIERIQREMWGDNTAYEIKLKKTDDDKLKLLIDSNGTVIKQKNKD
jgi:hypothetical protein